MNKTYGQNFKSPINTSRGNNAFGFSKGQRFQPTNQLACKTSYYNPNFEKTNRSASFGLGERSQMANIERRPSPGDYDPLGTSKLTKGYTFGHNKRVSFVDDQAQRSYENPGPNKYERALFGKSCSFSFRSKYEDPLQRHKNKLGPGQYKINGLITSKGDYFQSKYKSSGCGKIGREKRFESSSTFTPGPGKYKDTLGIDPTGTYFNSKIQSKGIRTFGRPNNEPLFFANSNPGPGMYFFTSSFSSYLK